MANTQLPDLTFPSLYGSAEQISANSQQVFLWSRRIEYGALVVAAAVAQIPNSALHGGGSIAALICFAIALIVRISGVGTRAEKRWYEGRAAAESIKSAAWQFAVCGEAYRFGDTEAEQRFLKFLQKLPKALPRLDVPADVEGAAITAEMKEYRKASRPRRSDAYIEDRVKDQLAWYNRKSNWNRKRARGWLSTLIGLEGLAILLGLARVMGWFDVDWLGVFAAAAASVGAWQQTKNFSSLSEAYAVTSHDIQLVLESVTEAHKEEGWAQAVHDAEAAFSREHTLWLARRQGPQVQG